MKDLMKLQTVTLEVTESVSHIYYSPLLEALSTVQAIAFSALSAVNTVCLVLASQLHVPS